MKILFLTLLLSLVFLCACKEPVRVSLLVEAQEDDGEDFLEIKLIITQQDQSLAKAITSSNNLAQEIKKAARTYCAVDLKNKGCDDITEISHPEIESKYQVVRKESTFQHFIVKREITIKVDRTDAVGTLVDQLQKLGVSKFEQFNWKSEEQNSEEEIVIQNAQQRINDLCEAFEYKFDRIVEIEEVEDQDEDKDDEQGGDEEQDDEPNTYRVVAECVPSKSSTKK